MICLSVGSFFRWVPMRWIVDLVSKGGLELISWRFYRVWSWRSSNFFSCPCQLGAVLVKIPESDNTPPFDLDWCWLMLCRGIWVTPVDCDCRLWKVTTQPPTVVWRFVGLTVSDEIVSDEMSRDHNSCQVGIGIGFDITVITFNLLHLIYYI